MSPRKNRRHRNVAPLNREAALSGAARIENRKGVDWSVRVVPAFAATKTYRCPGCDQEIHPGTTHVVAWPSDGIAWTGPGERRHWHTGCWRRAA